MSGAWKCANDGRQPLMIQSHCANTITEQTQIQIQIRQPVVIQFYIAGGSGTRQKAQLVALSPVISETILISAGSSRCNPSAIVFIVIVVIQVQVYMQLMSQ